MTPPQKQRIDALQVVGLILVAGFLLFLGVVSFANRLTWQEPTDAVVWEARSGNLVAMSVAPGGAGDAAGIRVGDHLRSIDGQEVPAPVVVEVMLANRELGERLEYIVDRGGGEHRFVLFVDGRDVDNTAYIYLAFVGLAFLIVGIFALLHRPDPAGRRFFFLAVAFYALFALSATTRDADPWNRTIYWFDQVARDLVPGAFLFFALTFPRPKKALDLGRVSPALLAFVPGMFLLALNIVAVRGYAWFGIDQLVAGRLFNIGERLELIYVATAVALGVLAFAHTYKHARAGLERMRLKWLVGGTALGFLPLAVLYIPLEVVGIQAPALNDLAVLPLALVPLSFGYAVVGFRLWDVEVLLKRGLTYAVALLVMLGAYFGARWGLAQILGPDDQIVQTASLLATLLVAVGFAPLRDRLGDLADRIYYRDSYRARRTLRDFGRELNSETDLARVHDLLVQRVHETLNVGRVALLLRVREHDHLRIVPADGDLDSGRKLSSNFSQFVAGALARREFLYVADLDGLLEEFPEDLEILETEDLAYFLPLDVKGDVIGVLALGRKLSGDYLSTEDLKVLQPLAAHLALAIDNALLYREVQRRARELERLKSYNENIVESMRAGVMVLDDDSRVLSWNRALAQIHGVETEAAIGKPVAELFPRTFLRVLDEARGKVLRGLEPMMSAYRIPLRTRSGEDRVVTLAMAPLLADGGGDDGTVIIVDDVTERTELESQVRQAEKLTSVGLLAAGVAHEVNTPLAGISSYVQMLQRKVPATDPRRAILEKIEKQTFRASQIVNNLLNFSRQETGDFRQVDLNDVVHDTLALAEIQLRKRSIRVRTELGEDLIPVMGDPIKLQQVLMNLVLNARDAMPKGGELLIRTSSDNGESMLLVKDSGTGIEADNLEKVYDPFFTTKGVGKGTGLGLSVSYGIIQEHRGTIDAESIPGEGTTFRIVLPSIAGGAQAAAS